MESINRHWLKRPDEFIRKGRWLLDSLAEHRMWVLGALGGLILIVALWMVVSEIQDSRLEKSWDELYAAEQKKGADRNEALRQVYRHWKRTRCGALAAMEFADASLAQAKTLGEPESVEAARVAADWYGKALEFRYYVLSERDLLTVNLGQSWEMAKDYTRAQKGYEEASHSSDSATRYWALLQLARLAHVQHDDAKAEKTWRTVIGLAGDTVWGKQARQAIRVLSSPLMH